MFERRSKPILPLQRFAHRVSRHVSIAFVIVVVSWGIGIVGYHVLEGLAWIDATLNAAMILGGMGPVDPLHTTAGKLFASLYALYSGVVFIAVAGITLAPFMHRLMHTFHLENDE